MRAKLDPIRPFQRHNAKSGTVEFTIFEKIQHKDVSGNEYAGLVLD